MKKIAIIIIIVTTIFLIMFSCNDKARENYQKGFQDGYGCYETSTNVFEIE